MTNAITDEQLQAIENEWSKELRRLRDMPEGSVGIDDPLVSISLLLQALDERDETIAELRKPVAVDKDWQVEDLRETLRLGHPIAISLQKYLLSAYDTLAQDCARYANAQAVAAAEMRGLRERLADLEQYHNWASPQVQRLGKEVVARESAEERERQLRDAIYQALYLDQSAWLAPDTRTAALLNLQRAALAASPAPECGFSQALNEYESGGGPIASPAPVESDERPKCKRCGSADCEAEKSLPPLPDIFEMSTETLAAGRRSLEAGRSSAKEFLEKGYATLAPIQADQDGKESGNG